MKDEKKFWRRKVTKEKKRALPLLLDFFSPEFFSCPFRGWVLSGPVKTYGKKKRGFDHSLVILKLNDEA